MFGRIRMKPTLISARDRTRRNDSACASSKRYFPIQREINSHRNAIFVVKQTDRRDFPEGCSRDHRDYREDRHPSNAAIRCQKRLLGRCAQSSGRLPCGDIAESADRLKNAKRDGHEEDRLKERDRPDDAENGSMNFPNATKNPKTQDHDRNPGGESSRKSEPVAEKRTSGPRPKPR